MTHSDQHPPWYATSPTPADSTARTGARAQRRNEMRVTPRTLRIGYETYPLRNIARVSVQTVEWAERPPIREVGPPLIVMAVAAVLLAAGAGISRSGLQPVAAIALLVGLLWLLIAIARKRYRTALIIESAGQQSTALVSKDENTAHNLEHAVLDAIENPPTEVHTFHIGDVVHGDKVGGNKYQQRPDENL